jgi:hypothetical protein
MQRQHADNQRLKSMCQRWQRYVILVAGMRERVDHTHFFSSDFLTASLVCSSFSSIILSIKHHHLHHHHHHHSSSVCFHPISFIDHYARTHLSPLVALAHERSERGLGAKRAEIEANSEVAWRPLVNPEVAQDYEYGSILLSYSSSVCIIRPHCVGIHHGSAACH